ncbi:MAG: nucleotidyltransferase [Thermoplasmatota archaeon]|jgi:NDP-sugar pyrophosphorylase family protein
MINLIPAAGLGIRFSREGYKTPKPLLDVAGEPMIIRACETMPKPDSWIFILRKEHVDNFNIDKKLIKKFPKSKFIVIAYNTEGQLSSCLLAKDFINADEELFIGSCDSGLIYNLKDFKKVRKKFDVIPFTFTKQKTLANNPNAWGWVKKDNEARIIGTSIKVPVSDNPFYDFALTGAFYFKTGKLFLELADAIIKNNIKINNEFYVDSLVQAALDKNYLVKDFVVNKYISWGNPKDYEEFNFWFEVFSKWKIKK